MAITFVINTTNNEFIRSIHKMKKKRFQITFETDQGDYITYNDVVYRKTEDSLVFLAKKGNQQILKQLELLGAGYFSKEVTPVNNVNMDVLNASREEVEEPKEDVVTSDGKKVEVCVKRSKPSINPIKDIKEKGMKSNKDNVVETTSTVLETSNDVEIKTEAVRNGEFDEEVGKETVVQQPPTDTDKEVEVESKDEADVKSSDEDVIQAAYKSAVESSAALRDAICRDVEKELRPSKYLNRILKGGVVLLGAAAVLRCIQFLRNNT